ncbi:related to ERV46-component of copii vesicles [Serendipita indica DSM 11827]|uniref:Related to ERV46-component of copii vesicles n=1 Tax=Serendipita indica (strain DSM 11827) TaxID=1109443 RepID=G4TRQ2_SERID|nr:related to ERV46-component of copii vesicles [Serendipita indica DSM 11827]
MGRGPFSASSFKAIDAFGKTLEDVKIRTRTGAFLTFLSIGIICLLTLIEFIDYRTVYLDTNIEIMKARDERLTVNMNITFPRVPCFLLSLDATDVSGEHMREVSHNIVKVRLDSEGKPYPNQDHISDLRNEISRVKDIGKPGYCGSCYGGLEPEGGCCNTCEDVRKSYLDRGWAFSAPEHIEQCVREGWTEKIKVQANDGCQISGRVRIKKVASSLIFSFGRSFQANSFHAQELVPYLKDGLIHDFGHHIETLQFQSDDEYDPRRANEAARLKKHLGVPKDPLNGFNSHYAKYSGRRGPDITTYMFQYFIKVVSADFETLDHEHVSSHLYSYSSHTRNVGEAYHLKNTEGIETTHGYDAAPGLFINIDVSPMQVIHTEKRKPFAHFLTTFCAIIGGVLTVASLVDSALFNTINKDEANRR